MGCLVGWSSEASAHGRFPLAGQVAVDPSDPARVFARTTYGILVTEDGGNDWRWICPEGPGFDADTEDPAITVTAGGTLVVGTFNGLSVAPDACAFGPAEGTPEGALFIDVQTNADATEVVALRSNGIAADTFDVSLWSSTDDGQSWSQIGTAPPPDVLGVTLGLAPSDPNRIYITGRDGTSPNYAGVVMRSDDRGQTWQRFVVPGADERILPYLGGIDPLDPDIFFVGLVEIEDQEVVSFSLLGTQDGGATFNEVFTRDTSMPGFAISPDGSQIAIGGAKEGLWVADASTLQFTKVNETVIRCLTWTDAGLYACTDQFVDGFNLGLSTDDGATFTPLSELSSPCGPPECAADTPVGQFCPAEWQVERLELGATTCGEGGAGGSGGGGGDPAPPPPAEDDEAGCGCTVVGGSEDARPLLAAVLIGGLFGLRRRRRW